MKQKIRENNRPLLSNQRGAALMGVLVAIMVLGLMTGIAGSTWKSIVQQAKEKELLWRGNQYRKAIESYYKSAQGGQVAMLPTDLESLLKDERSTAVRRHLRKRYPDPMTGADWVLIKDPTGKISGVRSSSTLEPFKKAGFSEENKDFSGKTSYSEWQFIINLNQLKKALKTTTKAATKPESGTTPQPQ